MVIIDTDEKKVKGEVMDLQTGCSFLDGVEICGGTGLKQILYFFINPSVPDAPNLHITAFEKRLRETERL